MLAITDLNLQLTLSSGDWVVCLVMLAASIGLGLWMSLRAHSTRSSEGFFLAGRSLRWPIIGASLFATNIGAEHLVGLSGDAYRYGLKASAVELTTAFTLGVTCWFLLPYYVKNKIFTIPEFLEKRYDVRARVFFAVLMMVICIMTKMAFTLFAGALVLHSLLGWDVMTVVLSMAVLAAIVTIIGGFMTVAYTDAIQTVIMIVGCLAMLVIGLDKVGGWSHLVAQAGERMSVAGAFDDLDYPFWGVLAGAVYGGVFYWGIDQVNVQRLLGAQNLDQSRWGAMFATLLKLAPIFIFALPGVIAAVLYPQLGEERSKLTFVVLLNELLPDGLRGLVLAALMAALISSLLAVMNSVSTMAVRDFLLRFAKDIGDKKQVWFGRMAVLIGALLGVCGAYLVYKTQEGIYKYLQTISIYLPLPVVPAIVFGIISKRVNMTGAISSVVVGVAVSGLFFTDKIITEIAGIERSRELFPFLHTTFTENYTYRGLWATIIITVVLFLVSYKTLPPVAEKLEGTTVDWKARREHFRGMKDWRLQWAILSVATIAIYAWLW